jgi:hypothetical protein
MQESGEGTAEGGEEGGATASPVVAKRARAPRLTADALLGPDGLGDLQRRASRLVVPRQLTMGAETGWCEALLALYRGWLQRLRPRYEFEDAVRQLDESRSLQSARVLALLRALRESADVHLEAVDVGAPLPRLPPSENSGFMEEDEEDEEDEEEGEEEEVEEEVEMDRPRRRVHDDAEDGIAGIAPSGGSDGGFVDLGELDFDVPAAAMRSSISKRAAAAKKRAARPKASAKRPRTPDEDVSLEDAEEIARELGLLEGDEASGAQKEKEPETRRRRLRKSGDGAGDANLDDLEGFLRAHSAL